MTPWRGSLLKTTTFLRFQLFSLEQMKIHCIRLQDTRRALVMQCSLCFCRNMWVLIRHLTGGIKLFTVLSSCDSPCSFSNANITLPLPSFCWQRAHTSLVQRKGSAFLFFSPPLILQAHSCKSHVWPCPTKLVSSPINSQSSIIPITGGI